MCSLLSPYALLCHLSSFEILLRWFALFNGCFYNRFAFCWFGIPWFELVLRAWFCLSILFQFFQFLHDAEAMISFHYFPSMVCQLFTIWTLDLGLQCVKDQGQWRSVSSCLCMYGRNCMSWSVIVLCATCACVCSTWHCQIVVVSNYVCPFGSRPSHNPPIICEQSLQAPHSCSSIPQHITSIGALQLSSALLWFWNMWRLGIAVRWADDWSQSCKELSTEQYHG